MSTKWSLARAFAHFGVKGKNQRWSWSARSADGKTVALTLWKDRLDYTAKPIVYDTFRRANLHVWIDRPGNRERIENLIWARDHCDGLFRVVITVAKDVNAEPRKIEDCYPKDNWLMQIVKLDETTGQFRAAKIETKKIGRIACTRSECGL
jgi:hypothetical protein